MKAILTATWAALLFVTSLPASAARLELGTQSIQVDYSDLDLTRANGVSTLEHRVNAAVHQVCGPPAFELREKTRQQRSAGTAAFADIKNAITTARELPSTKSVGTATTGAADKTIPGPSQ